MRPLPDSLRCRCCRTGKAFALPAAPHTRRRHGPGVRSPPPVRHRYRRCESPFPAFSVQYPAPPEALRQRFLSAFVADAPPSAGQIRCRYRRLGFENIPPFPRSPDISRCPHAGNSSPHRQRDFHTPHDPGSAHIRSDSPPDRCRQASARLKPAPLQALPIFPPSPQSPYPCSHSAACAPHRR